MKCLSLWQPWASWMAWGVKSIETRSWYTSYRGPLLIHAAKTEKGCEEFFNTPELLALWRKYDKGPDDLPFGAIIAVADLAGCRATEELLPMISETVRLLGNYEPGRFGWMTRNAREFAQPIPYRGMQGLFDVPDEVVREAIEAVQTL